MTKERRTLPFSVTVVITASRTAFIPFQTYRRQVRLLLMTQGSLGFPIDVGCENPRSQTRDLGHPICYLVISRTTCRRQVEMLGMTKGRGTLPFSTSQT